MTQLTRISNTLLWDSASGSHDWIGRPVLADVGTHWICVYRSSVSHGPTDDGRLHIRYSDDEGATWTAEDTLLDNSASATFPLAAASTYDPSDFLLIVAPNGDLLLHVLEQKTGSRIGTRQYRSEDAGETWTSEGIINSDSTLEGGQDYEIVGSDIYASFFIDADSNQEQPYGTAVYKSTDNGGTWTLVGNPSTTTENASEIAIAKVGSTNWLAVIRAYYTDETTWISTSSDSGANWTPAQRKIPFGELMRPKLRYDGSRLVLWGRHHLMDGVNSNVATVGQMCVWYSDDSATTWVGPFFPEQTTYADAAYGDWLKRADGSYYMLTYSGTQTACAVRELIWKWGDDNARLECGTFVGPAAVGNVVVPLSRFTGVTPAAVLVTAAPGNQDTVVTVAQSIYFGVQAGNDAAVVGVSTTALTANRRHDNTKAITYISAATGNVLQDASLTLADGQFTAAFATVGPSSPVQYRFLAIGGTGVSAKLVQYAANTSTGNQTLAGAGFTPTAAIAFGISNSTAPPDTQVNAAQLFLSVFDGTNSKVLGLYAQDNVNPQNVWKVLRTGSYVTMASTGLTDEGTWVAFNSDGGVINFSDAPSTAHVFWVLWLAGIDAEILTLSQPTSAGDQALTVSEPMSGMLLLSAMATASTAAQAGGECVIGFCDANNSVLSGCTSEDGVQNNVNQVGCGTYCMTAVNTSDAVVARGRLTTAGASPVITWDTADATAREFIGLSFAAGISTGAATLIASAQTLSASATFSSGDGTYTGAAALSASSQTLSATATFDSGTFTAAAALQVSSHTVTASATFDAGTFTATAALTPASQIVAASATFVGEAGTYTATANLTAASQILVSAAEMIGVVWPDPTDVRLGVVYGPTGAEYEGELVAGSTSYFPGLLF